MTSYRLRSAALDDDGCAALHQATLRILSGTGIDVPHDEALELLRHGGAKVEGSRARIPAGMVEDALAAAPRSVIVPARGESASLRLEPGRTYFGTGSDCLFVLGPGARDRRPGVLDDVEEMSALQQRLANIDFVMSMVHPYELPADLAPVAQFAAMLRGTDKPLIIVPETAAALDRFADMAEACGARDSWALYAMPTPPLVHGHESADRIVRAAQLGVPLIYASALLQGATAPASPGGHLIVANAEMLSGLVIAQLARPGSPFVYGVAQGWMNPRTGLIVYAGPEEMAVQQASADLARFYGLPSFGNGGCSDSMMLDEQWAMEAALTLLTAALSGVTLLHDVGYVASGTSSSYESIVLMDELIAYVKAYLGGVTIDESCITEIEVVGPGGTHLGRKYSRRRLREFFRPQLVAQESHDAWEAQGEPSLLQRVAYRTRELRKTERAYRPPQEALQHLEQLAALPS